ncbi:MAG: phosphotransferase [Kiritimatiellae bacterium]|nr:phosphotransferase [Kiritimatiellia bacterium]
MAKKAVVLAAGFGTRLRPLTSAIPKPLLPVWGEPMISRAVEFLREKGIEEIAVNAHYLGDKIAEWAEANGCKASKEEEILGTGGALDKLRDWIGKDDFYLVNGDVIFDGVPDLEKEFEKSSPDVIAVAAVTEAGPRTIEIEPESSFVTNWASQDPGWNGTWTFSGITLLKNEILDYVKRGGFSTIIEAFEKAMMEGKFVKGVTQENFLWEDAGSIDSYFELNSHDGENAYNEIPQIKEAIKALGLGEDVKTEFLGARGSDRMFFRLGDDYLIIYDDEKRPENARYAPHARWLKEQGIKVPQVLWEDTILKTLVLENAGSEDLLKRSKRRGEDRLWDYVAVVEELAKFSNLDASKLELEPKFDAALYKWERDLFTEHFLKARHHIDMSAEVEKEFTLIAQRLEKQPLKLVHRDFQSSNIIWSTKVGVDNKDDFKFIDFQGMRLGPAAYDLASLLFDPYIDLREGERRALAALYAKKSGDEGIVVILPFAAVERLVQALGAYGRLTAAGKSEFAKFIMPALENLLAASDAAGLDAIGALAEDLIAKEQKKCTCGHHHHDGEDGHKCTCGHHHEHHAHGEEGK